MTVKSTDIPYSREQALIPRPGAIIFYEQRFKLVASERIFVVFVMINAWAAFHAHHFIAIYAISADSFVSKKRLMHNVSADGIEEIFDIHMTKTFLSDMRDCVGKDIPVSYETVGSRMRAIVPEKSRIEPSVDLLQLFIRRYDVPNASAAFWNGKTNDVGFFFCDDLIDSIDRFSEDFFNIKVALRNRTCHLWLPFPGLSEYSSLRPF